MEFIFGCIKGIALGAGAILPGISSGVLCVVFGIYEKLVDSVLNFFKDIKSNSRFLIPIIIGIGIGVILFGNLLKFLYNNFQIQTKFCFIGLILGSLPSLFKTANNKNGFRLHYLIYTLATFLFTVTLLLLEKKFSSYDVIKNTSFTFLVFAGFVMSIGVVVPGVSSSVLLMILGVYDVYLSAVSSINLYILVPIGIGLIIGGLIFLKLIKYCLDKYHLKTYYAIIGFVLGSILVLYPGISLDITGLSSALLLVMGFYISSLFEKKEHSR